jgi:hypothetical protein
MSQFAMAPDIRTGIILRAEKMRSMIPPESESSAYISLIANGVRRPGKIWLGVILSNAVYELNHVGFLIISIVTDNASNKKVPSQFPKSFCSRKNMCPFIPKALS